MNVVIYIGKRQFSPSPTERWGKIPLLFVKIFEFWLLHFDVQIRLSRKKIRLVSPTLQSRSCLHGPKFYHLLQPKNMSLEGKSFQISSHDVISNNLISRLVCIRFYISIKFVQKVLVGRNENIFFTILPWTSALFFSKFCYF